MAYTNCNTDVARNIARDCANRLRGGYTGRFILWAKNSADVTLTKSAQDARILTAVSVSTGGNVIVGDNAFRTDPLTGSTTTGVNDAGYVEFQKSISLYIPERGSDVSKDLVEPLANSVFGFEGIFEKLDEKGNGSYEWIGGEAGLKADPTTITRNEYENGAAIAVTLGCKESYFEGDFVAVPTSTETEFEASKAAFEALLAKGF